eukprot:CAMPEP_0201529816 /NCGR_PEP_ID=MMETSP0161_2-20130828/42869_1 /ASSEMBLY_ACC=CAM_ASM_000251 /TAXON_ID=180227 /ORGANISM="Neoparamoeba aestuarina, Strain SoJaBio B1-5/56/2" /LENGTH=157 /DNA_ID=CAMNT_0047931823 /DNA_START=495 /DNA_END=968 /DNA_ORIENTATION=+
MSADNLPPQTPEYEGQLATTSTAPSAIPTTQVDFGGSGGMEGGWGMLRVGFSEIAQQISAGYWSHPVPIDSPRWVASGLPQFCFKPRTDPLSACIVVTLACKEEGQYGAIQVIGQAVLGCEYACANLNQNVVFEIPLSKHSVRCGTIKGEMRLVYHS